MSEQVNWRPDDVLRVEQQGAILVDKAGHEYRVHLHPGGNWAVVYRHPSQIVIGRVDIWSVCGYLNQCHARVKEPPQ